MMAAKGPAQPLRPPWLRAAALVLLVHGVVIAGMLSQRAPVEAAASGPVVLVELLPPAEPRPAAVQPAEPVPGPPPATPLPLPPPALPRPPIAVAPIAAPLPREVVALPPPAPSTPPQDTPAEPAVPAPPTPPAVAPAAPAAAVAQPAASQDPRARQQEADYFSLLNAHLARKKRYPHEARRARQQGVVKVRFTVHRDGRVSDAQIRHSSGQPLLDAATLDLLQRVSPLPSFPRGMTRDSVTVTLPIDYSLRTE